jgi:uncharacterized protein
MKISKYIVKTCLSKQGVDSDKILVFSTRTSKMFYINHSIWRMIQSGEIDKVEKNIIDKLMSAKIIVDDKDDELSEIITENDKKTHSSQSYELVIQPSAHCSLGCGYCGQVHTKNNMQDQVQEGLLERVKNKLNNDRYNSLSVCWFGAEPLSGIQVIRNLSPKLIEITKSNSQNYYARMVTNGVSLNLKLADELIQQYHVKEFEITLDGMPESHDTRRFIKGGAPSFKQIYNNLKNLAYKFHDIRISIRMNIDDRNYHTIIPLIDKLSHDGLLERCGVYFAPIHSWGNDADRLVKDKKKWADHEIKWISYLRELNKKQYPNLIHSRKHTVCIATTNDSDLIDPFGRIFNCTEISLVPTYEKEDGYKHQLGSVESIRIEEENLNREVGFKKFSKIEELKKYPCGTCNIFPICGGSCPKEWMEGRSPCPIIKYNIEDRLVMSYLDDHTIQQPVVDGSV